MLEHVLTQAEFCWCRPEVRDASVVIHRWVYLTLDDRPRATGFLADGVPV